jgi:site-specific DNA-methyltransferase (adenine-specific)
VTVPYYTDEQVTIWHGDCRDVLAELPDASVDAVCTDPPYELNFMGKAWDRTGVAYDVTVWREALRVLKPGGHLLAFGGTRTWHRLTVAVEDAGFEIRDSIAWLYGSGFPKSLDVSKAIDKAAGAAREVVGERLLPDGRPVREVRGIGNHEGWGTALKPAFEPIVVARKPLAGTVAANVLEYGTGALNIDACRVESGERPVMVRTATTVAASSMSGTSTGATSNGEMTTLGRWPANATLDESQAAALNQQTGVLTSGNVAGSTRHTNGGNGLTHGAMAGAVGYSYADSGGASRFFPTFRYEAKAPSSERPRDDDGSGHATVKPLDLIRWLVRLVTPPGGVVLDPFLGSGTTAEACIIEGFRCVAIDDDMASIRLVEKRLAKPIEVTLL